MKKMTKRLFGLVMAGVMMLSLAANASVAATYEEQLPPWVLEGETWHLSTLSILTMDLIMDEQSTAI